MLTTSRLILVFFRTFQAFSLTVTACCAFLLWTKGLGIFSILFWFKIITLALLVYHVESNKPQYFYYFQNLGLTKTKLWAASLGFDFALFILSLTLAYQCR